MKKLLMIAIAAFALMACGEKDKYDAALDEYEAIIDKTVEAIKSGDQTAAENLDRKLTDLAPVIEEIDTKGTEAQKSRKQSLVFKLLGAMFGSIDTTQIKNAFNEALDSQTEDLDLGELGEDVSESLNEDAEDLSDGLKDAANEIKETFDR